VPASLIEQENGMGAGRNFLGNLRKGRFIASVLREGKIKAAPLPCFGQTSPKM
jgi:hypothetical protein